MHDLVKKHLTNRLRCALWAEVEQNPERLAVLAESVLAALDAVQDEARRRGMSVPVVLGDDGCTESPWSCLCGRRSPSRATQELGGGCEGCNRVSVGVAE